MDFKDMKVKVAFANFVRELMQQQQITVQRLAEDSGYSERNIQNYLNPKRQDNKKTGDHIEIPASIAPEFYKTMQTALNFQHDEFRNYFEKQQTNQTGNSIGQVNITGGSFKQTVFTTNEAHFHNDTDD